MIRFTCCVFFGIMRQYGRLKSCFNRKMFLVYCFVMLISGISFSRLATWSALRLVFLIDVHAITM